MSESPSNILNKTLYVLSRQMGLTPQELAHLHLADLHLVGKNPYLTFKKEDGSLKKVELDLEAHRALVGWLVARPDSISDLLFVNENAEPLDPLDIEQVVEDMGAEEAPAEPPAPPEDLPLPEEDRPRGAPGVRPPGPPEAVPPSPPERGYVVREVKPGQTRPVTPPVRPAPIKPPPSAPETSAPPPGLRPAGPIPPAPPPPMSAPEADDLPGAPRPRPGLGGLSTPSRPVTPISGRESRPVPPVGQKPPPTPVGRREPGYTPRAVAQKPRTPPPPVRKADKEPSPELMPQEVELTPRPLADDKPVPEGAAAVESETPAAEVTAPPQEEARPLEPVKPEVSPEPAQPAPAPEPAQPVQGRETAAPEPAQPAPAPEPAAPIPAPQPAQPAQPGQAAEAAPQLGLKKPAGPEKIDKPAEGPVAGALPGSRRLRTWSFGAGGILLFLLLCAGCGLAAGYFALQTEMGHDVAVALRLIDDPEEIEATETAIAEAETAEAAAATPDSPVATPTLPPTQTPTPAPPTETPTPEPPTDTPTPEVVETPTDTPVPTDTPLPTDTPTPTPPPATPTPVPTEAPAEEEEPTPGFKYGAPALIEPEENFRFIGGNTIVLRWQPVGELASDEQYAVRLIYRFNNQVTYQGANIKETEWTVPLSLYNQIDPPENLYEWYVVVERVNEDGTGTAISPESEHRHFTWK